MTEHAAGAARTHYGCWKLDEEDRVQKMARNSASSGGNWIGRDQQPRESYWRQQDGLLLYSRRNDDRCLSGGTGIAFTGGATAVRFGLCDRLFAVRVGALGAVHRAYDALNTAGHPRFGSSLPACTHRNRAARQNGDQRGRDGACNRQHVSMMSAECKDVNQC